MRAGFFFVLLFPFLVLISCNQNQLGASYAVKNFIKTPYDGIKNFFSNREYERVERKTHDSEDQSSKTSFQSAQCRRDLPLPEVDLSKKLVDETRSTVCSCKAWGTCDKTTCSCEKLCPNNFDIFKRPPNKDSVHDLSSKENSMAFRNMGAMVQSNIEGTQGYCWGHASLTSQFNRLGIFKEDDQEQYENLNLGPDNPQRQRAIDYYKGIIDDIANNGS